MEEAQNEIKIVTSAPFINAAGLMEMKKNFATVINKLKVFEKLSGEQGKAEEDADTMKIELRWLIRLKTSLFLWQPQD